MADELKQENKCCCGSGKLVGTIFKVILGLVLLSVGAAAIINWWGSVVVIFKGCIGIFLAMLGIIILAVAK